MEHVVAYIFLIATTIFALWQIAKTIIKNEEASSKVFIPKEVQDYWDWKNKSIDWCVAIS